MVFRLMSVLQQADHQIEHDPQLYNGAAEMVVDVSCAIAEAPVLLYSPEVDPFFEDLVKNADRTFCFEQGPRSLLKDGFQGRIPGRRGARGHCRRFREAACANGLDVLGQDHEAAAVIGLAACLGVAAGEDLLRAPPLVHHVRRLQEDRAGD